MSLSLRINQPAGREVEKIAMPKPELPSAINGFYTQVSAFVLIIKWNEYKEPKGFKDLPSELLDAIHWFASHHYTTELEFRTKEYPEAMVVGSFGYGRDWRHDMFYGLDGSALMALGILLIEVLRLGNEKVEEEVIEEAHESHGVVIEGPLDDYLEQRGSLISPRNYFSRKYFKKTVTDKSHNVWSEERLAKARLVRSENCTARRAKRAKLVLEDPTGIYRVAL
jgi:hypothetical protein